jgi:hypothetical protein
MVTARNRKLACRACPAPRRNGWGQYNATEASDVPQARGLHVAEADARSRDSGSPLEGGMTGSRPRRPQRRQGSLSRSCLRAGDPHSLLASLRSRSPREEPRRGRHRTRSTCRRNCRHRLPSSHAHVPTAAHEWNFAPTRLRSFEHTRRYMCARGERTTLLLQDPQQQQPPKRSLNASPPS